MNYNVVLQCHNWNINKKKLTQKDQYLIKYIVNQYKKNKKNSYYLFFVV